MRVRALHLQVCNLVRLVGSVHRLFAEAMISQALPTGPLPRRRSRPHPPADDSSKLMHSFWAACCKHRLLEAAVDLIAPLTVPFRENSCAAYDAIGMLLAMSALASGRDSEPPQLPAPGGIAPGQRKPSTLPWDSPRTLRWAVDALLALTGAISDGSLQLQSIFPQRHFVGPLVGYLSYAAHTHVLTSSQLAALARSKGLPVLLQLYASGEPGWAEFEAQNTLFLCLGTIDLTLIGTPTPSHRPQFTAKELAQNLQILIPAAGRVAALHQISQLPPAAHRRAVRRTMAAGRLLVDRSDCTISTCSDCASYSTQRC